MFEILIFTCNSKLKYRCQNLYVLYSEIYNTRKWTHVYIHVKCRFDSSPCFVCHIHWTRLLPTVYFFCIMIYLSGWQWSCQRKLPVCLSRIVCWTFRKFQVRRILTEFGKWKFIFINGCFIFSIVNVAILNCQVWIQSRDGSSGL